MKSFFLLIAMLAMLPAFAIVHTVSNSPATLAQFNTIQDAVDASASGDSIYVHGSPVVYAGFTITNKQLVIIGPGWAPHKSLPLVATVGSITITGASSANTEIQGLRVNNEVYINANHPDNIRFIRNHFISMLIDISQGSATYNGYLFEGNIFDNAQVNAVGSSTYQNFIFHNNYFYESGSSVSGNIEGFTNSVNVLFNHNLWFGPGTGTRNAFTGNCRYLLLTNNIFVRRHASNYNSFSSFNNNITFNAGDNTPWTVNSNVDGGGNISNQDPQMVDQAGVNAGTNNALQDFTIASGPANNSGSDGKDMGLLYDATGSLNWTNSRNSLLPRIFQMLVTTPTVAPGGNITVNVDARVSN